METTRILSFCSAILHRECYTGTVDVENRIHTLRVEPFAGDRGAEIWLVCMVGEDKLDRLPKHASTHILDRKFAAATDPGPVMLSNRPRPDH